MLDVGVAIIAHLRKDIPMTDLEHYLIIWRNNFVLTSSHLVDDTELPLMANNTFAAGLDMLDYSSPYAVKDQACAEVVIKGMRAMQTAAHWDQRYIDEVKAARSSQRA